MDPIRYQTQLYDWISYYGSWSVKSRIVYDILSSPVTESDTIVDRSLVSIQTTKQRKGMRVYKGNIDRDWQQWDWLLDSYEMNSKSKQNMWKRDAQIYIHS